MKKSLYFIRGLGVGIIVMSILGFFINETDTTVNKETKMYNYSGMQPVDEQEEVVKKDNTETPTKTLVKTPTKTPTKTPVKTLVPTSKAEVEKENDTIKIVIKSGMDSEEVARMLKKKGVVDDSVKINSYIIQNGYAQKLKCGEFILEKNMNYDEIMDILLK